MFRNFDVNNDSFFSYFTFSARLMYQFFAAIGRVAALRREFQYISTHFCWKNTYAFTYCFSWIFLKCMDAPLDPEIPGFCPWGPWGTYFLHLELMDLLSMFPYIPFWGCIHHFLQIPQNMNSQFLLIFISFHHGELRFDFIGKDFANILEFIRSFISLNNSPLMLLAMSILFLSINREHL